VISRHSFPYFSSNAADLAPNTVGATNAFVNTLVLVDVALAPLAIPSGAPPGTAVGTLSIVYLVALVGQVRPPTYTLVSGGADNGAFVITPVSVQTGTAGLQFRVTAGADGKRTYTIRVQVEMGVGEPAIRDFSIVVSSPPPLPQPLPPPPRRGSGIGMFDNTGFFTRFGIAWYLRSAAGGGPADVGEGFLFGGVGWAGLAGDWTGQGFDTVGAVDTTGASGAFAVWYLRNRNGAGAPDIGSFPFGWFNWVPLAGDWAGKGHSGIGMFDPATATFYLKNDAGPGLTDFSKIVFGLPGWVPVVGDWTGSGKVTIGVVDPATMTWYLAASNAQGTALVAKFQYGGAGWKPVVGDWDGDGTTAVGVVDPLGTWYLRNSNSAGAPDIAPFAFGLGAWTPLGGRYTPAGQPLRAAAGPGPGADALADGTLQDVVAAALARLRAAGVDPGLVSDLASARYVVGALPGDLLGLAQVAAHRVVLSPDAAGYGWFADATPPADQAFGAGTPGAALVAVPGGAAAGRMDLLTTVLHEMGHLAGLPDRDGPSDDLMFDTLAPGVRKTQALDAVFARGTF
jgi:hypothetical protein